MIKENLVILCSYLILCCECRTSEKLKITLSNGSRLLGRYLTSDSGRGMRAFMGIPYAEKPIGELRWKAPQPKKSWPELKKAYKDGPVCVQRDPFQRYFPIVGDEDCLYLNVYTPEEIKNPIPVMVFFHGGGLMCGSGTKVYYGPDYPNRQRACSCSRNYLLDHDVIFVGVNYRLGPLGFLSTGDDNCPGNFGFKDQVEALRWVNRNIALFGGNPNLVTIFGESAGGASITYHMQSKMSKGLFHRGIAQSGTNLAPWGAVAHSGVAEERAQELGRMLNCSHKDYGNDYAKMLSCLRKIDSYTITDSFAQFWEWDTDPMVPFPPVVEKASETAFITENPRFIENRHGDNIPFMTGITSEEGLLKTSAIFNNRTLAQSLVDEWNDALPISLYYNQYYKDQQANITKEIEKFYFNGRRLKSVEEVLQPQNMEGLTNMWSDSWFFHAMVDYLKKRFAIKNAAPTYVYLLSHKGASSFTEVFKGGTENFYGTVHAEELQYLFPIRKDFHYFFSSIPTEQDKKMTKLMTKLWVNFAYNGNPTPEDNEIKQNKDEDKSKLVKEVEMDIKKENWKPAYTFPLDFMNIGNEMNEKNENLLSMGLRLYPERAKFWNKLQAHMPSKDEVL